MSDMPTVAAHNVTVHTAVSEEARRLLSEKLHKESQQKEMSKEIDRLKYVVACLEEKVKEMNESQHDSKEVSDLKNMQISELEEALRTRKETIDELNTQLKHGEDEFEILSEALEEKERALNKKNAQIVDDEVKIKFVENEVSRLTCINKTLVASSHKTVTEDVCLSARSFNENQLISLRDDALELKERQINLINCGNQTLNENICELEAAIETMQCELVQKDREISNLKASLRDSNNASIELRHDIDVKRGKDNAIEVATKQNTQLLQLLQQQETLSNELEERNKDLEFQITDLKERQRRIVKQNSEYEVEMQLNKSELSQLRKELLTSRSSLESQVHLLTSELNTLRESSHVTIEEQAEELTRRKEKNYELLERLQKTETRVHIAEDRRRKTVDEMELLNITNTQLEAKLLESQRSKDMEARKHIEVTEKLKKSLELSNFDIKNLENEKAALNRQLGEMSETVLKALGDRTEVRIPKQHQQEEQKTQMNTISNLENKLQYSKAMERNRLEALLEFLQSNCVVRRNNVNVVSLSNCKLGLTEPNEVSSIARVSRIISDLVSEYSQDIPLEIDLSNNELNDTHINEGIVRIVQTVCQAANVHLNLSSNNISPEGIRRIVLAMRTNPTVQNVYVHKNGKIQGLKNETDVVYSIDMKHNFPDSVGQLKAPRLPLIN